MVERLQRPIYSLNRRLRQRAQLSARVKTPHIARFLVMLMLFTALSSALELVIFRQDKIAALAQGDGILMYGEGSVQQPRWRDYLAAGSFDSEGYAASVGGAIDHVIVKSAPNRNEMIAGIQTTGGALYVQRYDGTTNTWTAEWNVTVAGGDTNLPRFDIAYEQTSGEAMVLYSTNATGTNEIDYNIWSGSSWGGAQDYNASNTTGTVDAIQMEPRSGSDEIGITWGDTDEDLGINHWSGTAFNGEPAANALYDDLGRVAAGAALTNFSWDVAFESSSGEMLVVFSDDGISELYYLTRTTGGTYTLVTNNTSFTEEGIDLEISADPLSDYIIIATHNDNGSDCDVGAWSGTAMGNVVNDATCGTLAAGGSNNAVNWVTSGSTSRGIVSFDEGAAGVDHTVFNRNTPGWAVQSDYASGSAADIKTARFRQNPFNNSELILVELDSASDVFVSRLSWNGSSFTWTDVDGGVLEQGASSITGFAADFAYKKYVPNPTYNQSSYQWFNNADVTNTTTRISAIGDLFNDGLNSISRTTDGGYIGTGYNAYGAAANDMLLAKFDASANLVWSRVWGGTSADAGEQVVQTSDGGYAVTGSTSSFGTAGDMFLAKYDSNGNLSWDVNWGGASSDSGNSLAASSDGGVIVAGNTSSFGAGGADAFIAKYDSAGTLTWDFVWGGTGTDNGRHVVTTSDGGYALSGTTTSFTAGSDDMFLAKYDSAGTLSWDTRWGGTGSETVTELIQASDGGYAIVGSTPSFGAGSNDAYLAKYDSAGTLSWDTVWGGTSPELSQGIVQNSDGSYTVAGTTESFGAGNVDVFLAKFDSAGTLSWDTTWGNLSVDQALSLSLTNEGGYIVAGTTTSYGVGNQDVFIAKYDSTGAIAGCSGSNCQNPSATSGGLTATTADPSATTSGPTATTGGPTATLNVPPLTTTSVVSLTQDNVDVGSKLNSVAQDTATTAPSNGAPFRLRLNVHVTVDPAIVGLHDFKLQYAQRGSDNLCDTSFTGETFADVNGTTPISYYNEQKSTDGAPMATNANDPTHSSDTLVRQEYQAGGTFGIKTQIPTGQDGMWDIALTDENAPATTTYCLRAVKSDGTTLSYTVVPQITSSDPALTQSNWRWLENKNSGSSSGIQAWGSTVNEVGNDIVQTSDGGYAITGDTTSFGVANNDMFIAKYDSTGTLTWDATWGGASADIGRSIVQTSDGGYAVTGSAASFGTGGSMFLAKYDSSGTLSWDVTWGGSSSEAGRSVIQTSDGGFAVTGETASYGTGGDMFLVKYDSSGTIVWDATWGGASADGGREVVQTSDSGYAVTGFLGFDMILAKYDSAGTLSWDVSWGGGSVDYGAGLAYASDGGYAVTGFTSSFGTGGEAFLAKYDSSGTLAWDATWGGGGGDESFSVTQTTDGGYAITGYETSFGSGGTDMFIVKYDSSGTLVWDSEWGGSGDEFFSSAVVQTTDGGYALVGVTDSFGAGNQDVAILKYDSAGNIANCSGSNCSSPSATTTNPSATTGDPSPTTTNPSVTPANPSATVTDPAATPTFVVGVVGSYIRTWGGTGTEEGYASAQTEDGGVIVVGDTTSFGAGSTDAFLIKYHTSGFASWDKAWGGSGIDSAKDVAVASDGSVYIVGVTASFGAGGNDAFIAKLTSGGTLTWSRTLGAANGQEARGVDVDAEGNVYMAGSKDTGEAFLAKYNSGGDLIWTRWWSDGFTEGLRVVARGDSVYMLAGHSSSLAVIKYSSTGELQWDVDWAGASSDSAKDMDVSADGSVYVVGDTQSFGAGSSDGLVIKFDNTGTLVWNKTWGTAGSELGSGVGVGGDGSVYVNGYDGSYIYLLKYDSSGSMTWSRRYDGAGATEARDLEAGPGGLVSVGHEAAGGVGDEMLVAKYNLSGTVDRCGSAMCLSSGGSLTTNTPSATVTDPSPTTTAISLTEGSPSATSGTASGTSNIIVNNGGFALFGAAAGSALAAQNTQAKLNARTQVVRLRLLLAVSGKDFAAGANTYKLQYAPKVGTCDASFTGESYVDIPSSSLAVTFSGNSLIGDSELAGYSTADPTSSNDIVRQTYEEGNYFSSAYDIPRNDDGLWDFAITPGSISSGGTYCFRVVTSAGTAIAGYNTIPELWIPPSQDRTMRHGSFFSDGGEEDPYYW